MKLKNEKNVMSEKLVCTLRRTARSFLTSDPNKRLIESFETGVLGLSCRKI